MKWFDDSVFNWKNWSNDAVLICLVIGICAFSIELRLIAIEDAIEAGQVVVVASGNK